jgi:hypothetical protein
MQERGQIVFPVSGRLATRLGLISWVTSELPAIQELFHRYPPKLDGILLISYRRNVP